MLQYKIDRRQLELETAWLVTTNSLVREGNVDRPTDPLTGRTPTE